MKKILRVFGIIILLVVVVVLITGALAPNDLRVERSIVINGPKAVVGPQMAILKNWNNWISWKDMDPELKVTLEGTDGAPGSRYHWQGPELGEGEITIEEQNGDEMKYALRFIDWDTRANGYTRAEDAGNGQTRAVFALTTHYAFPFNGIMVLMNAQKMFEKDFDKSLAKLKDFVESGKAARQAIEAYPIEEVPFPAQTYAAVRKRIKWQEMEEFYQKSYSHVAEKAGDRIAGNATDIYYDWNEQEQTADVAAGFPVRDNKPVEGAQIIELPASRAFRMAYSGSYSNLQAAHNAMAAHLKAHNQTASLTVQEYVRGPQQGPDSTNWLTHIYYLVP